MSLIPLSKIGSAVNAILPASFTDEMRKSVQIAVLSTIRLQLREKIEAMEELTTELQRQIENEA